MQKNLNTDQTRTVVVCKTTVSADMIDFFHNNKIVNIMKVKLK